MRFLLAKLRTIYHIVMVVDHNIVYKRMLDSSPVILNGRALAYHAEALSSNPNNIKKKKKKRHSDTQKEKARGIKPI